MVKVKFDVFFLEYCHILSTFLSRLKGKVKRIYFLGLENLNLTLSGWELCWTTLSFMFSLLFFQGKRSEGRVKRTKQKENEETVLKFCLSLGKNFIIVC